MKNIVQRTILLKLFFFWERERLSGVILSDNIIRVGTRKKNCDPKYIEQEEMAKKIINYFSC